LSVYFGGRIFFGLTHQAITCESLQIGVKIRCGKKAAIVMPKKILVVEDDPDARRLIESILKLSRLSVVVAADGQEGLDRAKAELPDVIITDIAMPRLNGLAMIRELRGMPDFKKIPILAITSYGMEKAMEAIKAGANRALARPVENHLLLVFVFDLLKLA